MRLRTRSGGLLVITQRLCAAESPPLRANECPSKHRPKPQTPPSSTPALVFALFVSVSLNIYLLLAGIRRRSDADNIVLSQDKSRSTIPKPSSLPASPATPIPMLLPSQKWLSAERLSNVDLGITKADVKNLLAIGAAGGGSMENILQPTVCSPDSPLAKMPALALSIDSIIRRNITSVDTNPTLAAQIIYTAIHEVQYGYAREEAQSRLQHWDIWESRYYRPRGTANTTAVWTDANTGTVGRLDFECPDAKFLVVEDGFKAGVGLGSSLRQWGNVPPFITGLVHGRVTLYVQNNEPVTFAGCNRRDLQCSFMPTSPCTITREEYDNAVMVSSGDIDAYLLRNNNDRVVRVGNNRKKSIAVRGLLRRGKELEIALANSLEEAVVSSFTSMGQSRKEVRTTFSGSISDILLSSTSPRKSDGMTLESMVEAALHLFITRPNKGMRDTIDLALEESFPADYDPTKAIGMPIRASDKCVYEANCIKFDEYMSQLHSKYDLIHGQYRHVILTSEDGAIMEASVNYAKESNLPFTFITNRRDVLQGHGYYDTDSRDVKKKQLVQGRTDVSRAAVMASTMATWAFQMRPGQAYLNLCSNFHTIIEGSIHFGCSAVGEIKAQDVKCNPGFRLLGPKPWEKKKKR